MSFIIYLGYLISVFLSSILNFYDTLGVSPFEFFGDVVQDVVPVNPFPVVHYDG